MKSSSLRVIGLLLLQALVCLGIGLWGLSTSHLSTPRLSPSHPPTPRPSTEMDDELFAPFPSDGQTMFASGDGISESLRVGPKGPYFLSESLAVEVSLTNHGQTVVYVTPLTDNGCGFLLGVMLSGGGPPTYDPPPWPVMCPGPVELPISPGNTFTARPMLPLTASGHIHLSPAPIVFKTGTSGYQNGLSPMLDMTVDPHIPANRALSLRREGSVVTVSASDAVKRHLFYQYVVMCDDPNSNPSIFGNTRSWQPLIGEVIRLPSCPHAALKWQIAVTAIGYPAASATYSFGSHPPS